MQKLYSLVSGVASSFAPSLSTLAGIACIRKLRETTTEKQQQGLTNICS